MKATHALKKRATPSICLLCLHRLSGSSISAPSTALTFPQAKRHLGTSGPSQRLPVTSEARQDDEDDWLTPQEQAERAAILARSTAAAAQQRQSREREQAQRPRFQLRYSADRSPHRTEDQSSPARTQAQVPASGSARGRGAEQVRYESEPRRFGGRREGAGDYGQDDRSYGGRREDTGGYGATREPYVYGRNTSQAGAQQQQGGWGQLNRRQQPQETTSRVGNTQEDSMAQKIDRRSRFQFPSRPQHDVSVVKEGVPRDTRFVGFRKDAGRQASEGQTGFRLRIDRTVQEAGVEEGTQRDLPVRGRFDGGAENEERPRFGSGRFEEPARFGSGRFEESERDTSFDAGPKHRDRGGARRRQKYETFGSDEEDVDMDFGRKKDKRNKRQPQQNDFELPTATPILIPPFISVANLATALKVRVEEFIGKLQELGFEEIANDHVLNAENAGLVAMEYNFEPIIERDEELDLFAQPVVDDKSLLPQRPPVVTIMGHVDHGKTTLLDYLRNSSVAASEAGGITQHIGAFSVPMASTGKTVTFLDTPGHAAFLSMRQRGANVTDIVILVVAADDSVKPQTIEAIKHARAARVPIIVAINKADKDEADPERVKQDLMRAEIEVEDFGGDVQAIPVSGKTGLGMAELEEAAVTLAEILDLRADTTGPAEGWVLEATTKKAGRVATVLVRRGTLRPGDVIVAGTTWARVRSLHNDAGIAVTEAGPGMPVEVDGWRDQPAAGDEVLQAPGEGKATSVVAHRLEKLERLKLAEDAEAINESRRLEVEKRARDKAEAAVTERLDAQAAELERMAKSTAPDAAEKLARMEASIAKTNAKFAAQAAAAVESSSPSLSSSAAPAASTTTDIYALIRADVSGSAEAIAASMLALPLAAHNLTLHILRSAVGPVAESDVAHISTVPGGRGLLVNFNQPLAQSIAHAAAAAHVPVLDHDIIYKVLDAVRAHLETLLPDVVSYRVTGDAELAQVFEINVGGRKTMKIAGARVRNGLMERAKKVRVWRGGVGEKEGGKVVFEGALGSLKVVKKDVTEVRKGSECGVGFEGWEGFQVGDVVQCFEEKRDKRRLLG